MLFWKSCPDHRCLRPLISCMCSDKLFILLDTLPRYPNVGFSDLTPEILHDPCNIQTQPFQAALLFPPSTFTILLIKTRYSPLHFEEMHRFGVEGAMSFYSTISLENVPRNQGSIEVPRFPIDQKLRDAMRALRNTAYGPQHRVRRIGSYRC